MKLRSGQQAFESFQRLGAILPGFFEVLADVKDISSLQSVVDEIEKRKIDLEAEIEAKRIELAGIKTEIENAKDTAARDAAVKLSEADAAIQDRQRQAEVVISAARTEEKSILANANERGQAIVAEAQARAVGITEQSAAKQQEFDECSAQTEIAKDRLAELRAQIVEIEKQKSGLLERLSA